MTAPVQPTTTHMNRLCIYFYYDPEGIVDEYITDVIREMRKYCTELVAVCNGKLTENGRHALIEAGMTKIYKRKNIGFDVWAYKHALEMVGWKKLRTFDEVILMNFTIMGPVYPLSEMFETMDARRDLDFWGLTVHHGEPYDPWGVMPHGVIPEHLQSHFIAIRQTMLKSKALESYWANMRPITSYIEAIGYHEAIFTETFAKKGFRWASYIDTSDLGSITSYPLMFMPVEIIKNRRCPFFKRKAFFLPIEEYLGCTNGEGPRETLDFLAQVGYDTTKIFKNINRSCNQFDLRITTQQFYMPVPSTQSLLPPKEPKRLAIAAYVEDDYSLHLFLRYIAPLETVADVFLTVAERFKGDGTSALKKAATSYVIGTRKTHLEKALSLAKHYAVVGFASHFYMAPPGLPIRRHKILAQQAATLFGSPATTLDITSKLLATPHIGMYMSSRSQSLGPDSWSTWKDNTFKRVLSALRHLKVAKTLDSVKPPLAPVSGFCLIKSSVLRSIDYERSKLLAGTNDTILFNTFVHALPFLVQEAGTITGSVISPSAANEALAAYANSHISHLKKTSSENAVRRNKNYPKHFISNLYWDSGKGYTEKHKYSRLIPVKPETPIRVTFTASREAAALRFDPVEGVGAICKNARASINGKPIEITPTDALRYDDIDMFMTSDPQYYMQADILKGDHVVVEMDSLRVFSAADFLPITDGNDHYAGALREALCEMQQFYEARIKPANKTKLLRKRF